MTNEIVKICKQTGVQVRCQIEANKNIADT